VTSTVTAAKYNQFLLLLICLGHWLHVSLPAGKMLFSQRMFDYLLKWLPLVMIAEEFVTLLNSSVVCFKESVR
jgi:hypothetical protein